MLNWNIVIINSFIQYILSPGIVISVVLFIAYKLLSLGELKASFIQALADIKNLKTDVKELQKDGKILQKNMAVIATHLVNKTGLDSGLLQSHSPISLKPAGIEIVKKSGFPEIVHNNKDWFIKELKKYPIKSLADVDEASFKLMQESQEDEKFINFKELAFQKGISLILLQRVLSIYLRDELGNELVKK